ncbi:MAG: serine/threonine protein phosphatase, partial [Bacteroidales bacterium]|nr:serine/threonine protein phosphatase [Bacteroidales bacterium]
MRKHWVIPDIHGCAKTLRALIEEKIKPTKHDELYFLGDYVDRGPDSKGTVDYIMNLQKEEYNLKLLIGNHEEYCMKAIEEELKLKSFLGIRQKNRIREEWENHGGDITLRSLNISNLKDFPANYIQWMKNLEYYFETENFIMVHAGLNFRIENPFKDKHAMLWIRDYKIKPEKINNKKLIHGHIPVSLEFIDMCVKDKNYNFIDLDNGVYMD